MALRILYLTAELPYFPGQGGLMALQLRHLAGRHFVGVVGPRYPGQPEDALQRLRDTVQRTHWWPESPTPGPLPPDPPRAPAPRWLTRLPRSWRRAILARLTGLHRLSDEAWDWRFVLTNLAPKLLEALEDSPWNAVLLSQSASAAWLPFLPASVARCVYLHDVRSDYLRHPAAGRSRVQLQRLLVEEQRAAAAADSLLVVTDDDRDIALRLLAPAAPVEVAPVCLDLEYFSPGNAAGPREPVVLFTGHLAHPPNVDAALHLLASIWPQVRTAVPDARLQLVGLQPTSAVRQAAERCPGVELAANVPDVRPYYRRARAYVVPMRFGGGVRQKILEAWAMGVPVVSTRLGARGISFRDGENGWIRDSAGEIAAKLIELLRAPADGAVTLAARREVEGRHAPDRACPRLEEGLRVASRRRRETPPKVLFDLRWLQAGKPGGVEQMTCELIDEIARVDPRGQYRIYGPRALAQRWRFPPGFAPRLHASDADESGRAARKAAWIEALAASLGLPPLTSPEVRALEWYARLDFTVVHGIPGYVHPDLRRFPAVVTVHDLQHLHFPEYFAAEDIATREREYRESCARATHVICPSEFTRRDVHARFGVPLDKLTTIWNLPPRLTESRPDEASVRRGLSALGVTTPYFYYPAQPWLHKNHAGLIEAMRLAAPRLSGDWKLVLTGQPPPAGHPAAALLEDPAVRRRVLHLGYRTAEEVRVLYRGATALVFPSRFEGFGLPVVEAMQQGCPVVCGDHTSLPEIAGDAAHFVDVTSTEALAEGMVRLATDPALRARLIERGAANLARFNRRELAARTVALYASAHERHFG